MPLMLDLLAGYAASNPSLAWEGLHPETLAKLVASTSSDTVFVDAGSRGFRVGRRESIVGVKLAALLAEGGREEIVYHSPGGEPLDMFVARLPGRAPQAATYVVELAACLAYTSQGYVCIKHGPLVRVLNQLLSKAFDVERETMLGLLRYAGLDNATAREVLEESTTCDGRANMGMAALSLLSRLEGKPVYGVVEDTSQSTVLGRRILAELVSRLWKLGATVEDVANAIEVLVESADKSHGFSDCVGLEEHAPKSMVEQLLSTLRYEAHTRLNCSLSDTECVEAAASLPNTTSFLDATDDVLVHAYNLVWGPFTATRPLQRGGIALLARDYLESSSGRERFTACRNIDPQNVVKVLSKVYYAYVLPGPPPSCKQLSSLAEDLGVETSNLLSLVYASPPIRLESLCEGGPRLEVVAYTYLASTITVYGYPSHLLVVDRASRVGGVEALLVEVLAEKLASRLQPYTVLFRRWRYRRLALAE